MQSDENVNVHILLREHEKMKAEFATTLQTGGGGGTYDGMSTIDIRERLSRVEGGTSMLKWAVALVSSVLIGLSAVIVALQIGLWGEISGLGDAQSSLSARVEALPGQINQNLMEMNRTMLDAVQAGRAEPIVIIAPEEAPPE